MPGASNPVASTPGHGISHSKSFRTRLGFGSSSGSGGPSNKPSFFTHLKAGRKSFGGPGDVRPLEQPVLAIDPEPERQGVLYDNRVVLNEDTEPRSSQSHVKYSTESPTEDASFARRQHIASHSLPTSPIDTHRTIMGSEYSSANSAVLETRLNSDESGISKHLPDISADLSLLINEPPPDTTLQSDFHESRASASSKGKARAEAPLPGSSPAALENHDQNQRWNIQELLHIRSVASSPPGVPQDGLVASQSAVSGLTNSAVENASASFDLSSARLSLDIIHQSIGEDWARSLLIEGSAIPSADTSGMISPSSSSVAGGSRPATSTPVCTPNASLSPPREGDAEISFDLDALDPDLVALLRPNNHNHGPPRMNHIATPTSLEPFAPPPDPLNPGTSVKRPTSPPTSLPASSSPHRARGHEKGLAPPPMRKYATLTASTSQSRLRSYTIQDISPSHASKPSTSDSRLDLSRLQTHVLDGTQPSPSPTIPSSSDTGTPSDASKHASPLSGPPLTLGDLERNVKPSPAQSSSTSISTNDNITMRRRIRAATPAQIQTPRPGSALASSTDSRPAPRYTSRERDYELRPASASPSGELGPPRAFGSLGRERERVRPSINGFFPARFSPEGSAGRPASVSGRPFNNSHGGSSHDLSPFSREREWQANADRRYRKRSMSLDQASAAGFERRGDVSYRHGGDARERFGLVDGRDRMAESMGYEGSESGYGPRGGLGAPYDGRDRDRDRERYGYGYAYGDRDRIGRPHTDWLGPRTAKAFAAAGLLDDSREASSSSTVRYGNFSRSASERDVRTPGVGGGRERRSPVSGGFSPVDSERERGHSRYNLAPSVRSGSERDPRSRAGAESPSIASMARPPSRGESWSHNRPAPLFARTMSDLMSQRGSTEGRESVSVVQARTGSAYSASGPGTTGGSAGSGGGRASPTTTSSLVAMQAQVQSLKDKHDTQTEALLAALADSQRTSRELKEENESLKSQARTLEERLVEAIASSRQREKEHARAARVRPHSPERTRTILSRRDPHFPPPPPKPPIRNTPSPTKRRFSTSSSIFPVVSGSMSLLLAETPESPPQGSLGSGSSPPSPTLVLPRPAPNHKSPERQGINGRDILPLSSPQLIPTSHKRSTSGASMATSANFSFETGSPGSLKLKPEHELLLGDMTRLSLVTGFGGDSESEGQ